MTISPAQPSAGCVWDPKETTPPGSTAGSPASASSGAGRTPQSASISSGLRREPATIGTIQRFWNARSPASASAYCSQRRAVSSSSCSFEKPPSAATRSAVASIPSPVLGSQPKESSTQFSLAGVPPGAPALG